MNEQEAMNLILAKLRTQVAGELERAQQATAQFVNGLKAIFGHCDLSIIAEWARVKQLEEEARQMVYRDYLKQTVDLRRDALEAAALTAVEVAKSKTEGDKIAAAIRQLHWK